MVHDGEAHTGNSRELTAGEIAAMVGGKLRGEASHLVSGVNALEQAKPEEISLVGHAKYADAWRRSRAKCALVSKQVGGLPDDGRTLIIVDDAEVAMITILTAFAPMPALPELMQDASSAIHSTATIAGGVRIGPHVFIGRRCSVGEGAILHAGVRLYDDVHVGEESVLHAGVVIRERCRIGRRVTMHPNVTIGADGFGYRPAPDGSGLLKVPHLGGVIIGDEVEIGANSCIDRGKFGDTQIGEGTKIDNLVQIAHNCTIGRSCIIAALCGLSGSVTLGDGAILAGNVGVTDHVTIGPGAIVGAGSGVMDDIPAGQTWLGSPATESRRTLRQWAAVRKLPELIRSISGTSRTGSG